MFLSKACTRRNTQNEIGKLENEICDLRKEKNKDSNLKNMKKSKMEITMSFSKDIRNFFANHGKVSGTKKKCYSTDDVVQLIDEY